MAGELAPLRDAQVSFGRAGSSVTSRSCTPTPSSSTSSCSTTAWRPHSSGAPAIPRSDFGCCGFWAAPGTRAVVRKLRWRRSTGCSPTRTRSGSPCLGPPRQHRWPSLCGRLEAGPNRPRLARRGRALADDAGDDYLVAVNEMLIGYTADNCDRRAATRDEPGTAIRRVRRRHGSGVGRFSKWISAAWAMLDDADFQAAARESRYLRDWADRSTSRAALYLGDLERCVDVARGLSASRSLRMAESAVTLLGAAAVACPRRVRRRRGCSG